MGYRPLAVTASQRVQSRVRRDLRGLRSALLGHARIDTTQIYTKIRPPRLKRAIAFYEDEAEWLLSVEAVASTPKVSRTVEPGSRNIRCSYAKTWELQTQENRDGGSNEIRRVVGESISFEIRGLAATG